MITVINQIKGKIGNNNTQKGHDTSDISSCIMFTVINVKRVTRCSRGKWLSKHFKIYIMKIVVLFVYYLCLSKIFTKTLRMRLFFVQSTHHLVRCFQLLMMSHLLKNIVWLCYLIQVYSCSLSVHTFLFIVLSIYMQYVESRKKNLFIGGISLSYLFWERYLSQKNPGEKN